MGLDARKTVFCVSLFANNKGADQSVRMHSLICTFVYSLLANYYLNLLQVKFQFSN